MPGPGPRVDRLIGVLACRRADRCGARLIGVLAYRPAELIGVLPGSAPIGARETSTIATAARPGTEPLPGGAASGVSTPMPRPFETRHYLTL